MTNLTELSRRVSKAEGPSRELDAAVYIAFTKARLPDAEYLKGLKLDWLPAYTASIDAVAALIAEKLPTNWHWLAGHAGDAFPGLFTGMIMPPGLAFEMTVRAKTPALALLAAALLAIHERNKSDE